MSSEPLQRCPGTYEDEGLRIWCPIMRDHVPLVAVASLPFKDPRKPGAMVDRLFDVETGTMWCSQTFYDYAKSLCVYPKDPVQ